MFLVDLSRALGVHHEIDVVELAPYAGRRRRRRPLLKDVDTAIEDRDVIARRGHRRHGADLGYLGADAPAAAPASLAAATLLDRPYRRLVDDVPLE